MNVTLEEVQFEEQLEWCIAKLELRLLTKHLSSRQAEQTIRCLNILKNESSSYVRKRTAMRRSLGDYRKTMAEEKSKSGQISSKTVKDMQVDHNKAIFQEENKLSEISRKWMKEASSVCQKAQAEETKKGELGEQTVRYLNVLKKEPSCHVRKRTAKKRSLDDCEKTMAGGKSKLEQIFSKTMKVMQHDHHKAIFQEENKLNKISRKSMKEASSVCQKGRVEETKKDELNSSDAESPEARVFMSIQNTEMPHARKDSASMYAEGFFDHPAFKVISKTSRVQKVKATPSAPQTMKRCLVPMKSNLGKKRNSSGDRGPFLPQNASAYPSCADLRTTLSKQHNIKLAKEDVRCESLDEAWDDIAEFLEKEGHPVYREPAILPHKPHGVTTANGSKSSEDVADIETTSPVGLEELDQLSEFVVTQILDNIDQY